MMPDLPPLVRISAAIEKLERERDDAHSGPWRSFGTGRERGDHWFVSTGGRVIAGISSQDGENEAERQPTADLIVTLHRTIEVQLETLRMAEHAERQGWGGGSKFAHMALRLADAILGGES